VPHWHCGQIVNDGTCGWRNFHYVTPTGNAGVDVCYKYKQPKKEQLQKTFPAGGEGKPSFANKSTLGAAVIEQMMGENIAIGVQQALDAHQSSNRSALASIIRNSGNVFSLGLGSIVGNHMDGDKTLVLAMSKFVTKKFGNNAEAYLTRSNRRSDVLADQFAAM